MLKKEINKFIGKKVEIQLEDDLIAIGYLFITGDSKVIESPNLYIPKNYYYLSSDKNPYRCGSFLLRACNIKKIKIIEEK